MIRLFLVLVVLWGYLGASAQTPPAAQQGGSNHTSSFLPLPSSLTYDTFFLEAIVQRQKGNNDAVFDLLQHCIKLKPDAAEAYYFLAQYYLQLKNDSLAGQNYLKAAELEPNNTVFCRILTTPSRR